MRVLITGARGQVGSELIARVPSGVDAVGVGSDQLDITDLAAVKAAVARCAPSFIINAAAYTAVDKAESESERAYAVNRMGVAHLAEAAVDANIPLIHISTDYVFPGDAASAYDESCEVGPTGVYGASKLAGEQALAESGARYLVLRTSWVFGRYGHNFVKTMLRLGQQLDSLSVVADQKGGPTGARSIADAIWRLVERYRKQGDLEWGMYHFSGAPACSWYQFASTIFEYAHACGLIATVPQVNPIGTADYPTPAKRPANSVLQCARIKQTFGIEQPDWRLELQDMLATLA